MIVWDIVTLEMFSLENGVSPEEAEKALDAAAAKFPWISEDDEDFDNPQDGGMVKIWDEAVRVIQK